MIAAFPCSSSSASAIERTAAIAKAMARPAEEWVTAPIAAGQPNNAAGTRLKSEVDLEPGQTATAKLAVQPPAQPQGAWLAIHLAQSQDGQLTGGYTVLIRTAG